jgi:hypothetical protein
MKNALSFLAGTALTTGAVIWAGGRPAGWFMVGGFTMLMIVSAILAAIGFQRLGRFFTALDQALTPDRAATSGPRKATKVQCGNPKTPANVVTLPEKKMLRPIQQDVVSALVNLGMSTTRAENVVIEASQNHPGYDFDTLLRACTAKPARAANA